MRLAVIVLTALAVMIGFAIPASAQAVVDFKTPKGAAYCGTDHYTGRTLTCWTPNDGFTISMRRRGTRVYKTYLGHNKGRHDPHIGQTLSFGRTWRSNGFRCISQSDGLTCTNLEGHGWWLGRYVGYRVF